MSPFSFSFPYFFITHFLFSIIITFVKVFWLTMVFCFEFCDIVENIFT